MKKTAYLLLVLAMVLGLCACGGKTETEAPSDSVSGNISSSEPAQKDDAKEKPAQEEKVPELIKVDLTSDNTLTIEGKQYALPMPVKEFLDSGWNDTYEHMDEKIGADKGMEYSSLSLDMNGERKISGIGAYNYTDSEAAIKDCMLISLKLVGVPDSSYLTQCSFTLPGGITEKSTYDDILAVYGTKDNSEYYRATSDYDSKIKDATAFEKYGFTAIYNSKDASVVPYNYFFAFNADKTIKYVEVECANFRSAASAAFLN